MWVNNAIFLPDGQTIVSGSDDGNLKFWEVGQGSSPSTPEYHNAVRPTSLDELHQADSDTGASLRQDACEVRFCAGGSKLAVLDDRPIIQVWDGDVKHPLEISLLPDAMAVVTVVFPDGQRRVIRRRGRPASPLEELVRATRLPSLGRWVYL